MLMYSYCCNNCGKTFDVMTFGGEVIIDNDFDKSVKELSEVKCPSCNHLDVSCTYDPCFDDFDDFDE